MHRRLTQCHQLRCQICILLVLLSPQNEPTAKQLVIFTGNIYIYFLIVGLLSIPRSTGEISTCQV